MLGDGALRARAVVQQPAVDDSLERVAELADHGPLGVVVAAVGEEPGKVGVGLVGVAVGAAVELVADVAEADRRRPDLALVVAVAARVHGQLEEEGRVHALLRVAAQPLEQEHAAPRAVRALRRRPRDGRGRGRVLRRLAQERGHARRRVRRPPRVAHGPLEERVLLAPALARRVLRVGPERRDDLVVLEVLGVAVVVRRVPEHGPMGMM